VAALLRGSGSSDVCGVSAGGAVQPARLPTRRCLRELRGLRRLRRAGVASPAPLMLRRHLLLTELVGANGVAAPSLADCLEGGLLSEADWMKAWELTAGARQPGRPPPAVVARLRVADRPVPLDGPRPPRAGELLLRDCRAVCGFFERARPGLPGLLEAADLAELLGAGEAAGDAAAATAEAAAADEESGEEDEDDDDDAEESGDEAGDLLH
uniref:non-specific serine/threonine protein kinase n=1 Tax=Macrostomum lignano TaxID=282301 RepID=A0A1I8IA41_9PLAT